jgi:hypothetical protein
VASLSTSQHIPSKTSALTLNEVDETFLGITVAVWRSQPGAFTTDYCYF